MYSSRVRRLAYTHPKSPEKELRQSVFDDVARTRLNLTILPNMHTLIWKGPLNLSVMFMHPRVKAFEIWLPDELESNSPRPFFEDVAVRMPNLINLSIQSYVAIHDYEEDMVDLLIRLPKLQVVTFPRFYLTSKLTEVLSTLPTVGVINFQYFQGCGQPDDVVRYTPILTEGAFPVLWDFSQTARFDDVARFLGLEFAPNNLTSLYVDSSIFETAASIEMLLTAVADNCQLLESLAVVSSRDSRSTSMLDYEDQHKITFDYLKPLLHLPNLKVLEIFHQLPLALKQEDLEILSICWPALKSLNLNNEPVILTQSNLSVEALLPFARHCPNLTHLGLFLNAVALELPLPSSVAGSITPFKRLERLSMGVSIIHDDNSVALYLSYLLPSGCTIDCGITWDNCEAGDPELLREVQQRCDRWMKVDKMLPVLVQLRMEEKERLKIINMEMDDLKMRNEVLSECKKSGVQIAANESWCIVI